MSRFSPTVKPTSRPGGLGGLAAALQEGVGAYRDTQDRAEGQRTRQFAQDVQRGGLLERGISIDSPEAPQGFGSAFAQALSGAPTAPARPPVPGGFVVDAGDFEKVDPKTGQPKLPVMQSGNATFDPNVPLGREMASATAKGGLGLKLAKQGRMDRQGELATALESVPGAPAGAAASEGAAGDWLGRPPQEHALRLGDPGYAEAAADAARARAGGGGVAPMSDVMRLRTDYRLQPAVKNARTIQTAFERISNTQDNAVGDLSLIFAYMKMLDPESVVRETEFANAQNAAGVPDQVRNLYNRVASGERLNPNQRAQFRTQAMQLAAGARQGLEKTNAEYRLLAERFSVDPRLIFTEDGAATPKSQTRRVTPNSPDDY